MIIFSFIFTIKFNEFPSPDKRLCNLESDLPNMQISRLSERRTYEDLFVGTVKGSDE